MGKREGLTSCAGFGWRDPARSREVRLSYVILVEEPGQQAESEAGRPMGTAGGSVLQTHQQDPCTLGERTGADVAVKTVLPFTQSSKYLIVGNKY